VTAEGREAPPEAETDMDGPDTGSPGADSAGASNKDGDAPPPEITVS
jgi:hypothetical protein